MPEPELFGQQSCDACFVPEGHAETSPTFQRWGGTFNVALVPKGRLNGRHVLRQLTSGICGSDVQPSLRD
jgi:hypothetical protein